MVYFYSRFDFIIFWMPHMNPQVCIRHGWLDLFRYWPESHQTDGNSISEQEVTKEIVSILYLLFDSDIFSEIFPSKWHYIV